MTFDTVMVITATEPGASFSLTVSRKDDCEKSEESPAPADDADCNLDVICGPSGYYFELITIN